MDQQSKKEILASYKQRKITGGVYAVRNTVNGRMELFSTADMTGSKNRYEFSLQTGVCVSMKLQKDWNIYGSSAFVFEVLEELTKKETQTEKEYMDDIRTLKELWREKYDSSMLY